MLNNKKGFTLIELLAVIVILAIIVLITVPIVGNIIKKAKIKAAEDIALIYVKEINEQNGLAELDDDEYIKGEDVELLVEDINPKIKSKIKFPSEGIVTFEPDFSKVDNAELCINKLSIKYDDKEARYQPDEDYCIFSNEPENPTPQPFVEPDGVYVRELCKGTSSYSSSTIYKVKKVEDMACLSKVVNEGNNFSNAQVQVVSDVDFKNTSDYVDSNTTLYGDINENGSIESLYTELTTGKGFKQIGNSTNKYMGSFIGNMFTLSNITINRPEENDVGIFGYNSGNIQKLRVNNINITGGSSVGGVAGYHYSVYIQSRIETIEATNVKVTGTNNVGGIVGYNNSEIINEIKFDTKVTGTSNVGGIIGYNYEYGIISNVVGSTEVTGTSSVGGIAGTSFRATINGVIIEGGNCNGSTYLGYNNSWNTQTNIYYFSGFTASTVQGTMLNATKSKNVSAYESAVDTIIGGDNDGTDYYFRFDNNNDVQLVSVEDYPINFTLSGTGTENDPYLISSVKEWNEATTKAQL